MTVLATILALALITATQMMYEYRKRMIEAHKRIESLLKLVRDLSDNEVMLSRHLETLLEQHMPKNEEVTQEEDNEQPMD